IRAFAAESKMKFAPEDRFARTRQNIRKSGEVDIGAADDDDVRHLPPVSHSDEAGPIERMSAQAFFAAARERFKTCGADGFGGVEVIDEASAVERRHPVFRRIVADGPEAGDAGAGAGDLKSSAKSED